ncbi:MAG: hypothetical protein PHH06_04090 [Candidatus Gracilibacteria bacterium]|nr:hypothetical protein [Candidatus Gracilibacteria bacterium]
MICDEKLKEITELEAYIVHLNKLLDDASHLIKELTDENSLLELQGVLGRLQEELEIKVLEIDRLKLENASLHRQLNALRQGKVSMKHVKRSGTNINNVVSITSGKS